MVRLLTPIVPVPWCVDLKISLKGEILEMYGLLFKEPVVFAPSVPAAPPYKPAPTAKLNVPVVLAYREPEPTAVLLLAVLLYSVDPPTELTDFSE